MRSLSDEEFDQLFRTFEHTAYRLERRNRYNVGYELDRLTRFVAGERPERDLGERWLANVQAATRAGKRFCRVRVISLPPSDYSRYGLWSSQWNVKAGEDIRYLARADAAAVLPDYDYWLFDSTSVLRFRHDDDRTVARELIDDPVEVVRHNRWRDVAWHHAVPRGEFIAQHGLQPE